LPRVLKKVGLLSFSLLTCWWIDLFPFSLALLSSLSRKLFNDSMCIPRIYCLCVNATLIHNLGMYSDLELAFYTSEALYMLYMKKKSIDLVIAVVRFRISTSQAQVSSAITQA
jgi:hypothetical protein